MPTPTVHHITIARTGKEPVRLTAYPTSHHRYPHIPVIRVEEGGVLVGYGQFSTKGEKLIYGLQGYDVEFRTENFDIIKAEVFRLLDTCPEAKPTIIRMKVSKGIPGWNIAEGENNFLTSMNGKKGVFDCYRGKFFPLKDHEWELAA